MLKSGGARHYWDLKRGKGQGKFWSFLPKKQGYPSTTSSTRPKISSAVCLEAQKDKIGDQKFSFFALLLPLNYLKFIKSHTKLCVYYLGFSIFQAHTLSSTEMQPVSTVILFLAQSIPVGTRFHFFFTFLSQSCMVFDRFLSITCSFHSNFH